MDEGKVATPLLPEWGLVESIWLRTHVHDGVVQMVTTMWIMVMFAAIITYVRMLVLLATSMAMMMMVPVLATIGNGNEAYCLNLLMSAAMMMSCY